MPCNCIVVSKDYCTVLVRQADLDKTKSIFIMSSTSIFGLLLWPILEVFSIGVSGCSLTLPV